MLRFFGRSSAFCGVHTNAYFKKDDQLILIDFSVTGLTGFRALDMEGVKGIRVLVTHPHSDHIGGIPLLIFYAHYILDMPITVIAPSEKVKDKLECLISDIEGCSRDTYDLKLVDDDEDWIRDVIPTQHVPELDGQCFGYRLTVDGRDIIYTGDTCTLQPFVDYMERGMVLYTEVAVMDSPVHLHIDKLLEMEEFFKEKDMEVYLMHMDDEEKLEELTAGSIFRFAPL